MPRVETDELRVGQRGTLTISFVNVDGQPVTPSIVKMGVEQPDGTVVTVTLSGIADVRDGTFDPTLPGWHVWRCEASGVGFRDAAEGEFFVHPARVLLP